MKKNLYEFSALIACSVVIAADNEAAARAEIESYEKAWFEGDFIAVSDVQLERAVPAETLEDAHVVMSNVNLKPFDYRRD